MAELLAIGKDLKGLTPATTLNADGSATVKLTGNATYKPELRLTAADVAGVMKGLMATPPVPTPPAPPASTFLKGLCTGYYNEEFADLKSIGAQVVRLGNPPKPTEAWTANGQKVIYLYETDVNGSYNTGGVQAIAQQAWIADAGKRVAANPDMYALEALNEPGGSWFWGPNAQSASNAAAYARLIRGVWEARKSWAVKPLILASCDGGHKAVQWLEWMYQADPKVWECFDYGTVHAYGGNAGTPRAESAAGAWPVIEKVRAMTGKPVAVTEVGWPTESETGDSQQWTEPEQAANVTAFLARAKASGIVSLATIYNYRGGSPGYGLARRDDSKKPAWAAFASA